MKNAKNSQAVKEEFERRLADAFVRATGEEHDDIYETCQDGAYDWWTTEDDGRSWIGGIAMGDLSTIDSVEEFLSIAADAVDEFAGQQEEEAGHCGVIGEDGEWMALDRPDTTYMNYARKMRAFAKEIRLAA